MSVRVPSSSLLSLLLAGAVCVSGCGGAQARLARHLGKGESFLAAGNFDKARVEFQNALQIARKDPRARLDMGVVDEKLGNPREAAQFYQAAIDVSPDDSQARSRLARLYLFSGAPDQAQDLIRSVLQKHPDDPRLLTVRAAARVQQKDIAGALADAERAVALAPTDEDAIAVLAGIYRAQGEAGKAQALLERSVGKIPGSVDLRLILAQIYTQDGRPADAESQLLKLIALQPKEKSHRLRLAQFYAEESQIDAAERTLRQAIKDLPAQHDLKLSLVTFLAARRNRETAEHELRAMIDAAPADLELQFTLAAFYQEGDQNAKAEEVYREIIDAQKLQPAGLTARDRLAALRLRQNDVDGAMALVGEVLASSPRDDDALLLRGNILLLRQDPRSAITDLRAVLRDQPNAEGVLRSLARAHLADGDPALAEETMRHAVEANPRDPALALDFAQLLMQLGKPDQAKVVIAELVRQRPDSIEALDTQYRISIATRDLATAKASADAIATLRPGLVMGYLYQANIAEAEKREADALRLYDKAAELQPKAPEPLEGAVRVLAATKRMAEAQRRLDEVSSKYPDASFALVIKSELLIQAGKASEAVTVLKGAVARTPTWWPAYRALAGAQLAAKLDPSAAIATVREAKGRIGNPEQAGIELASLLEQTGKQDEAMREYEDVLRRDPQSEVAANNLAMLLATYRSDPASLDRAKDLSARFANSANPSFLDTYGWVLFKRGDAADSVPVLSRVVEKAPNAAVARFHLGMAQSLAGDDTDARDNLQRAVNSGTRFAGLDQAKATLDKLAKAPPAATPKS